MLNLLLVTPGLMLRNYPSNDSNAPLPELILKCRWGRMDILEVNRRNNVRPALLNQMNFILQFAEQTIPAPLDLVLSASNQPLLLTRKSLWKSGSFFSGQGYED